MTHNITMATTVEERDIINAATGGDRYGGRHYGAGRDSGGGNGSTGGGAAVLVAALIDRHIPSFGIRRSGSTANRPLRRRCAHIAQKVLLCASYCR